MSVIDRIVVGREKANKKINRFPRWKQPDFCLMPPPPHRGLILNQNAQLSNLLQISKENIQIYLEYYPSFYCNFLPLCSTTDRPTNSLHTRQQAGGPWNHSYTLKLADSYNFAGRYLIIWGMFLKKKYEELLTYLPNQTWYTSEFVICARHLISPLYYSTTPLRKILNFRYKSQDIPTYWSDLVIVVINENRLTDWKIRNSLVKNDPLTSETNGHVEIRLPNLSV